MKKIADFIVEKRKFIMILFLIITLLSCFLSNNVKINDDISKYLPKNSNTKIGMELMNKEFKDNTSTLYIMFSNIKEKSKTKSDLEKVKGVSSVSYDESKKFNNGNKTLYILNVNDNSKGKTATKVYEEVKEKYQNEEVVFSGTIASANEEVMPLWIMVVAISCALVILILMCNSYIEPFLFLFTICLAVIINKGTNIIFNDVSNITDSICAILQMALSMDYSIMLMNRYRQEKSNTRDNKMAMKFALEHSFSSIFSSSLTTIVGLLALVFMTFTIGKDLGIVLAKGVLLSLICIFTFLPGLILLFDKLITKTKKKSLNIRLESLGRFSYNYRYFALALIIILFIGSFLLKGNLKILFTSKENDEIAKEFKENNQMAVIYNNKYEDKIQDICHNIDNKKTTEVLCYGNTIGEKLTFDNFNDKLKKLSESTDISPYVIRAIYYNYFNKKQTLAITLNDLINFIEKDVYKNKDLKGLITSDTKKYISTLKNFSNIYEIDKERSIDELATILDLDKNTLTNLLIYYNGKNINNKITLADFISFLTNVVAENELFASNFNNALKSKLQLLSKLNQDSLTRKYNYQEMASFLNLNAEDTYNLYLYYSSINYQDTKLTINEFVNFIISNVSKNENYTSFFPEELLKKLVQIEKLSNKDLVEKNMSREELSAILNMDKKTIEKILLLKNNNISSTSNMTLKEFFKVIENNASTLNIDQTSFKTILPFINNENEINTEAISKDGLKGIFKSELVELVYSNLHLEEDKKLTPKEFTELVINNFENVLDEDSLENIKFINTIINSSINNTLYNSNEVSLLLNIDNSKTNLIYLLSDIENGLIKDSPKEIVNFLISNKDNPLINSSLDKETLEKLQIAFSIIENASFDFDYAQMSKTIGIDSSLTKNIYALYNTINLKLKPNTLTGFILERQNDQALSTLNKEMLENVKLLNTIMDKILENKKLSYNEISNILNMDSSTTRLVFSYNEIYYGKNIYLSLNNLISFIKNDIVPNNNFSKYFSEESKNKINRINTVMLNTMNNYKYTANNLYTLLQKLSNNINKALIDLLYTYYGSIYNYDENYKLTIEEFINYLNKDILNDLRYSLILNKDLKNQIKTSKKLIDNMKPLIVGKHYSRIVINTDFELEDKEVFAFIKNLDNKLSKVGDDIYLIGNSPMTYELNKTFASEFNFISFITALFIFLVIGLTFKSIVVQLLLTLIIQCAVYITMGILSLLGGEVYFISLIIVQSILMGATIDYAILYTNYYIEYRKRYNKKGALIYAYNESIHTILTSSLILIIVTFIVGIFADQIASKICITISQGTLCATLLVLFILPPVLAALDKFFVKKP